MGVRVAACLVLWFFSWCVTRAEDPDDVPGVAPLVGNFVVKPCIVPNPDPDVVRIMPFGDSITQGIPCLVLAVQLLIV